MAMLEQDLKSLVHMKKHPALLVALTLVIQAAVHPPRMIHTVTL